MTVRRRDGIHIETTRTYVADASSAVGDVNLVSHAHADHAFRTTPETVVCSAETAALIEARTGATFEFVEGTDRVTLLPAGHVVGSRAALVEADGRVESGSSTDAVAAGASRGDADHRRYLYTGDFSVRDRLYLDGFEPVEADVLVMETTYGDPRYRFPPERELQGEIRDWLADNPDRPLVLFGYALGRAQKLEWLAREATDRRILAHESIRTVDAAIESATDLSFPAESLDADGGADLAGDEIVILPTHLSRSDLAENLVDRYDGLKAGFSGWAVEESFRYRGGYDATFPLSDHCDFDELVDVVAAVDPEVVYTHHGFAAEFADHLATELGYDARPLLGAQTRLDQF